MRFTTLALILAIIASVSLAAPAKSPSSMRRSPSPKKRSPSPKKWAPSPKKWAPSPAQGAPIIRTLSIANAALNPTFSSNVNSYTATSGPEAPWGIIDVWGSAGTTLTAASQSQTLSLGSVNRTSPNRWTVVFKWNGGTSKDLASVVTLTVRAAGRSTDYVITFKRTALPAGEIIKATAGLTGLRLVDFTPAVAATFISGIATAANVPATSVSITGTTEKIVSTRRLLAETSRRLATTTQVVVTFTISGVSPNQGSSVVSAVSTYMSSTVAGGMAATMSTATGKAVVVVVVEAPVIVVPPAPTPTPLSAGGIVGIVLGSVAFVAIIVVAVIFGLKAAAAKDHGSDKLEKSDDVQMSSNPSFAPTGAKTQPKDLEGKV